MDQLQPKKEGEAYTYQPWPSWATGPNGEREQFNSEGEVPPGWTHHGETKKGRAAPAAPSAPVSSSTDEADAAGTPFDPALHAATRAKTSKGLWRMKVGISRPEVPPPPPPAPPTPPPPPA